MRLFEYRGRYGKSCHSFVAATLKSWDDLLSLQWRHYGHDAVSNHQPRDCLLNRLFRRRSKKTSKFRATGLCAGTSPVTGEFLAQMASNAENVSIWWRHHVSVIPHINRNYIYTHLVFWTQEHFLQYRWITWPAQKWVGLLLITVEMENCSDRP